MQPISRTSLLIVLGATFITLLSIFFYSKGYQPGSNHIIKVSGIVDRIGDNGRTIFILKDNKTKFYIDPSVEAKREQLSLTKPGDKVEFTVRSKEGNLTEQESISARDFSNISLGTT